MTEKKSGNAPTEEEIRQRAYEIYLERGGEDGQQDADWLAAESELTGSAAAVSSGRSVAAAAGASAAGTPQLGTERRRGRQPE